MLKKAQIKPQSRSRTVKTQHTFASNDDLGQIAQQNLEQQNYMSKRQINFDQQFDQIYTQIVGHQYFNKISKHQKIRVNKWLTKLANISSNDLWKKNRNNYIKLIRLMFDCQIVIAPFQMMPPDRDLHKLTNHQINVIINQIEKLLNQKQQKNGHKSTERLKMNKVIWTQQSAYIDHQSRSQQKSKHHENDCRRTYESSSVTANPGKFSESHVSNLNVPPRYPASTKNQSLQKKGTKQCQFIKPHPIKQPIKQANKDYLGNKQRYKTLETDQMGHDQYVMLMKKSSLQRNQQIFEKQNYDINEQNKFQLENKSQQAINILKLGFKLLKKLPYSQLSSDSQQQIHDFNKILLENQFFKYEIQNHPQNRHNPQSNNINQTDFQKGLPEKTGFNSTQSSKVGYRKKTKLTLLSQSTARV